MRNKLLSGLALIGFGIGCNSLEVNQEYPKFNLENYSLYVGDEHDKFFNSHQIEKNYSILWKKEVQGLNFSVISKKVVDSTGMHNFQRILSDAPVISKELYISERGRESSKLAFGDLKEAVIGYAENWIVWHTQNFENNEGELYLKSIINTYNFLTGERSSEEVEPVFNILTRKRIVRASVDRLNGFKEKKKEFRRYGFPRIGPFPVSDKKEN